MTEYALIPKILPAFRRLQKHYEKKEEATFQRIIENAKVYIDSAVEYDNWNGGVYGHNVIIYVPEDIIDLVDLDDQDDIFIRLKDDLNKATTEVESEYVNAVYVKIEDESDPQCQAASAFCRAPMVSPNRVGLWKDSCLRLFISHRDGHKSVAHELSASLEPYGVSSFVAHDTIRPMKEWATEILNGLNTMEVMLVLLTNDFHESDWTNQEIGFALGKGIPIICVKVEENDPKGFVGSKQALKASYENIALIAPEIHKILVQEVGQEGRLKSILIEAFISSDSYISAIENSELLSNSANQLTEKEFSKICKGYEENDQLHGCGGIHNRGGWFKRYLELATGKKLEIQGGKIIDRSLDEIPF